MTLREFAEFLSSDKRQINTLDLFSPILYNSATSTYKGVTDEG